MSTDIDDDKTFQMCLVQIQQGHLSFPATILRVTFC